MDAALTAILSFLTLAIPTYFSPGPNNLMLMTSGAKFGVRRTVPHALGIIFGFGFMVFLVALGLGQLFQAYPVVKDVLRYAAAAYFLYLAWRLLGVRIDMSGAETAGRPMTFLEAAAFQWINPKAWAMATGYVAAFVASGDWWLASILWLTAGTVALGPFSAVIWVGFGRQLALLLQRTGLEHVLGWILAGLMLIAVALFVF